MLEFYFYHYLQFYSQGLLEGLGNFTCHVVSRSVCTSSHHSGVSSVIFGRKPNSIFFKSCFPDFFRINAIFYLCGKKKKLISESEDFIYPLISNYR